jgi:hypothetical protein
MYHQTIANIDPNRFTFSYLLFSMLAAFRRFCFRVPHMCGRQNNSDEYHKAGETTFLSVQFRLTEYIFIESVDFHPWFLSICTPSLGQ